MTIAKPIVLLDAGYQNYAWGKPAAQSFVAKMKNLTHETDKNFAELWVGTHPSCPSRIAGGTHDLLDDFLKLPENKATFFSPAHQASLFRDTVPYLLKILSISTALSIQAHPCKELAEKLHAAQPDKYKDPNHKPELVVALTAYEALCCFRPLSQIMSFLRAVPELAALVRAQEVMGAEAYASNTLPALGSAAEKQVLKSMMHHLYTSEAATCTAGIRAHLARLQAAPATARSTEDNLFIRLCEQYPDDVGCWMIYVLNYVQLQPGEGLFLSDGEPHAYLSGDGVEIMACSDNVVRGGLTPKWKDVPTLIEMLKYDTSALAEAKHERSVAEKEGSGWQVQLYQPPAHFPDFSIHRLEHLHDRGSGTAVVELPTIGLGFCLEGSAKINGVVVKAGDCFAVPFGQVKCQAVDQRSLVFISSTNDLTRVSKM